MANDVKYRINLGNCGNDINENLIPLPEPPFYRADTTVLTADNTELTADYSL